MSESRTRPTDAEDSPDGPDVEAGHDFSVPFPDEPVVAHPAFPAHQRSRLRLRARLTLAFGLGAFFLSMMLSAVAYGLTRSNLLERREESALGFATRNAQLADRRITEDTKGEDVEAILRDLVTIADAVPVLRLDGVEGGPWFNASSVRFAAPANLSSDLLAVVSGSESNSEPTPARMRYSVRDQPYLVIGVPLSRRNALYFEATPLDDIEGTLRSMGLALVGAASVTTMAGVGIGAWASRRVLLPLEEVSETAERLASGDLSARLEVADDRDLMALAASFNDMATNLEERIERDAQFASDVSHELRSPLMTIMASVEVLNSRRAEMPERAQTALDLLTSDLERFRQLVGDLLEISRYDVGGHTLDVDQFGITEFVQRVVADADHGTIPVRHPDSMDEVVVAADKRRLARVIANLIDNARYYAGGATGIELSEVGGVIEIAVEDRGPGVPERERSLIFGRFARGSEGGRRGAGTGTGLGLALAADHVRLHGGRIRVDDRPDGLNGARFVVELPIVVPEHELSDFDDFGGYEFADAEPADLRHVDRGRPADHDTPLPDADDTDQAIAGESKSPPAPDPAGAPDAHDEDAVVREDPQALLDERQGR